MYSRLRVGFVPSRLGGAVRSEQRGTAVCADALVSMTSYFRECLLCLWVLHPLMIHAPHDVVHCSARSAFLSRPDPTLLTHTKGTAFARTQLARRPRSPAPCYAALPPPLHNAQHTYNCPHTHPSCTHLHAWQRSAKQLPCSSASVARGTPLRVCRQSTFWLHTQRTRPVATRAAMAMCLHG